MFAYWKIVDVKQDYILLQQDGKSLRVLYEKVEKVTFNPTTILTANNEFVIDTSGFEREITKWLKGESISD